jgi:hypothetical protein
MRSYQVEINIPIPITLTVADQPIDQESMFRFLNDLITDVALDVHDMTRGCFEGMRQRAMAAGLILRIPDLKTPMGVGVVISDVTSQVGKQWKEKK